jgi:hypothetical protein
MPNLDVIHRDIRRIASALSNRIDTLESSVADSNKEEAKDKEIQITAMTHLRNCVRSAATIVSSASTILARDRGVETSTYYGSEFGDCFPSQTSDSTLEWISSSALVTLDVSPPTPELGRQTTPAVKVLTAQRRNAVENLSESDSDSDLDSDLALALYRKGKVTFIAKDYPATERYLRNCLSRISSRKPRKEAASDSDGVTKHQVLTLLCDTCLRMEKWEDAQSFLMDKISLNPHGLKQAHESALADISQLVTILYQREDYVQGQLYARRALRGYRKLGVQGAEGVERTLILLVEICRAGGNVDEEEAYAVMLEDILERNAAREVEVDDPVPAADSKIDSSVKSSTNETTIKADVPLLAVNSDLETVAQPLETVVAPQLQSTINQAEQPIDIPLVSPASTKEGHDTISQVAEEDVPLENREENPYQTEHELADPVSILRTKRQLCGIDRSLEYTQLGQAESFYL